VNAEQEAGWAEVVLDAYSNGKPLARTGNRKITR